MIKLLIGGSPCTYWSIAQKGHRETEASGLGWELFKNYLIAKEKFNPDYFLYENNKSAAQAIKNQIKYELGVGNGSASYIEINSALLSAQSRKRFYVHNIPDVHLPKDKNIVLKDILDNSNTFPLNENVNHKAHTIKAQYYKNGLANFITNNGFDATAVAEPVGIGYRGRQENGKWVKRYEARDDNKSNTLTTAQTDCMVAEPIKVGEIDPGGQGYRIYSEYGKAIAQTSTSGGLGSNTGLYAISCDNDVIGALNGEKVYKVYNGEIVPKGKTYNIKLPDGYYTIRKLSIDECKRLQTVPDDYIFPVSNSQAYKMLGNGWTCDVIAWILSHIPNIKNEEFEVLSMYDGMSCGHIALNKIGVDIKHYYAYEIDKYAIKTTQYNFPETIQMGDAFLVREDNCNIIK